MLDGFEDTLCVRVEARWAQRVQNGTAVRVATYLFTEVELTTAHCPQDVLSYGVIQVREKIRLIAHPDA